MAETGSMARELDMGSPRVKIPKQQHHMYLHDLF